MNGYRHRIDCRCRRRAERLARPAACAGGDAGRSGRPRRRQAGRADRGDRGRRGRLRRRRAGPGRGAVRGDERLGAPPDIVVYNASGRLRGPLVELDPAGVADALRVSAFGGFLVAQQAARRMLPRGKGAILFTGASASVKGYKLLRPLRHGQVRAAWPRPEYRPRAGAAGHPCRPFRDRRCDSNRGGPSHRRTDPSRPRCDCAHLPRTFFARTAAPGPGRSRCGHGSRTSSGAASARSPRRPPMPAGRSARGLAPMLRPTQVERRRPGPRSTPPWRPPPAGRCAGRRASRAVTRCRPGAKRTAADRPSAAG